MLVAMAIDSKLTPSFRSTDSAIIIPVYRTIDRNRNIYIIYIYRQLYIIIVYHMRD